MPKTNLDPREMERLNQQLAHDSFANEGGDRETEFVNKPPKLSDATRVIFSEENNRESELDDG